MTLQPPEPQVMVIFGASGDLTERKIMPALYNLCREDLLPEGFAVIGYSRSEMSDEGFRRRSREAVAEHSRTGLDDGAWKIFERRLHYMAGDVAHEGDLKRLGERLEKIDKKFDCGSRRLFYCATPPGVFPKIVKRIGEESLAEVSKIVVEKPFGEDLDSARELNVQLHEVFREEQIFRIDHYLGKETVQNVLAFRFSNGMFEPLWNRRYVKYAEITVAEGLGIEGRGRFYDRAGAIRDIAQNHLLQLLSLLTMEPPASFEAEGIRNEKVKVLSTAEVIQPTDVVRGQYTSGEIDGEEVPGYHDEDHVDAASETETYVAMKVGIENWRWAGVPFFLRTGKRLARRATTVTVVFHDAPHMLFDAEGLEPPDPNHLTIRIQPDEGISLTFDAKSPGPEMRVVPVQMNFEYEGSFARQPAGAYERLLHEAMDGDQTLFLRADEIERAWQIVAPILEPSPPEPYPAGSWGPEAADELIAPGKWHLR